MKNEETRYPVSIGEMTAALRRFSRCTDNEYERLIMTEAADELQKVQEARRRAVRRAQYITPRVKVKPRKVEPAEPNPNYVPPASVKPAKPRLVMVQVEGEEPKVADLNEIMATPEDIDRMIQEALEEEEKNTGEVGACCICGYKIHSRAVSNLPECNDCAKKRTCQHVPPPGAYTRINCFLWEPERKGGGAE